MSDALIMCPNCKEWVVDTLFCGNCNAILESLPCGC